MNILIKFSRLLLILAFFTGIAGAQSTKKEKAAAKIAAIKQMVDARKYVFRANFANSMRGGTKSLTSDYDLRVAPDTISAYLPYYGRAYVASLNVTDGGIKFTTTHFEYNAKETKKGWEILIKPKNTDITDMRDVRQLRLLISTAGYASLSITSSNRDPISFDGTIEEK